MPTSPRGLVARRASLPQHTETTATVTPEAAAIQARLDAVNASLDAIEAAIAAMKKK